MSPPLTDEEAARVERHASLVRVIAGRVVRKAGLGVLTFEDLISAGNEALVQAAMRFDPSSPTSFATYAHYRVYGSMIDAIRKRTPGRRTHARALIRLAATQELLRQSAEDQAVQRSAGQRSSLEQRVETARALVRKASLAVRLSEPEARSFESVAAEQPDPEQRLLDADQRNRLWTLVAQLEPHERELLEALYVDGLRMKDLAEQLGTTASTISRRHARILARLSKLARAQERGAVTAGVVHS